MSKTITKRLRAAERYIQRLVRERDALLRIRDTLVREHQTVLGQKQTVEALLYTVLAAGEMELPIGQVVIAQGGHVMCRIDEEKKLIRLKRVPADGK